MGKRWGNGACRHCRKRAINRPRQLCVPCYTDTGIRSLYEPQIDRLMRCCGLADFVGPAPQPSGPTGSWPGTEAKIAVLSERAQQGLALWHPLDLALADLED